MRIRTFAPASRGRVGRIGGGGAGVGHGTIKAAHIVTIFECIHSCRTHLNRHKWLLRMIKRYGFSFVGLGRADLKWHLASRN